LARSMGTARSVLSKSSRSEEAKQEARDLIRAIEERYIEIRRILEQQGNYPVAGLGNVSPAVFESKAEVRVLQYQLNSAQSELERLKRYKEEREDLKDKIRDLERDKRDLEHQVSKRSAIQEFGELLKDPEIKKMGLGMINSQKGGSQITHSSGVKQEMQKWLEVCQEEEATAMYSLLKMSGHPEHGEAFNSDFNSLFEKYAHTLQEQ
ncbi:hypothetical protein, partial [Phaeocystidibacter marisrubri]|uniref:hypothetical protein n=2 Tax=Phaeocystidibacter marisrubri TaxID=1577780 RepID=UPI001668DCF9